MTRIQWTQNDDGSDGKTWNPTVGCRRVSAGCEQCYAEQLAYRLDRAFKQPAYAGLTRKLPDGSVNWTGTVRTLPERLGLPLTWRKPTRVFVDSMSDLFHEDVPDEFIDQVFAMMAICDWHTFQVLTKRPERMLASALRLQKRFESETPYLQAVSLPPDWFRTRTEPWWAEGATDEYRWPLPNVWLGVSVEDQRAADERIPLLLQTPAAVRFLSCEPLIGPVNLSRWLDNISNLPPLPGTEWLQPPTTPTGWYQINEFDQPLHWVIGGGESGAKARPCDPEWARSLRDQCTAAGVPFFWKQWGGRTHAAGGRLLDDREWNEFPEASREAVRTSA